MRTIHRLLTSRVADGDSLVVDAELIQEGLLEFIIHRADSEKGPECRTCNEPVTIKFGVSVHDLVLLVEASQPRKRNETAI